MDGFLSDEEIAKLEAAHNPSSGRAAWRAAYNPDNEPGLKEVAFEHPSGLSAKGMSTATALGWSPPATVVGALDQGSLENLRYNPSFERARKYAKENSPKSLMAGQGAGLAGVTAASTGVNPLVAAAAQGFVTKPEGDNSLSDDLTRRSVMAAAAPALVGGMQVGGKVLKKGGDVLMQKALGRTKYTPGAGTELADAGIGFKMPTWDNPLPFRATRQGLAQQVAGQKTAVAGQINEALVGDASMNSSEPIAAQVRERAKRMEVPGASPSPEDVAKIEKIHGFANDIAARGEESPFQMWKRRQNAGDRAYGETDGLGKKTLLGMLSKDEQIATSKAMKDYVPAIVPLDARYAALAKASHALKRELPPQTLFGFGKNLSTLGLTTPAGSVLAAQGMTKAGQAAPFLAPAMVNAASGISEGKKKEYLTDEEMAVLEGYHPTSISRVDAAALASGKKLGISPAKLEAIRDPTNKEKAARAMRGSK